MAVLSGTIKNVCHVIEVEVAQSQNINLLAFLLPNE